MAKTCAVSRSKDTISSYRTNELPEEVVYPMRVTFPLPLLGIRGCTSGTLTSEREIGEGKADQVTSKLAERNTVRYIN